MDEIRVFGECACCGNEVTDADDEYYVNADGEVFCSIECVMDHCGVAKIEV